jgi:hypothetical protein
VCISRLYSHFVFIIGRSLNGPEALGRERHFGGQSAQVERNRQVHGAHGLQNGGGRFGGSQVRTMASFMCTASDLFGLNASIRLGAVVNEVMTLARVSRAQPHQ